MKNVQQLLIVTILLLCLLLANANSQQGEWQHPLPQGNPLSDWDMRQSIGVTTTDSLVFEALQYEPQAYWFDDFADNVMYVDCILYSGDHYNTIVDCFNAHGINTSVSCQQQQLKRGLSDNNNEISASDHTYFPLKVGNKWYYDSPTPPSNPWAMKMIRDSLFINGLTYYVWTYGDSVDIFDTLRADQQHNIWKYHNGVDYLWFDFQKDSGAIYNFPPGDLGENESEKCKVYVETNLQIETPAGIFKNCISFTFDVYQVKDEEITYTFAENTGPITIYYGYGGTQRLKSAIINGKVIASVDDHISKPCGYYLFQNYPNPFNPSTTIRFELPEKAFVTLKVFDVFGHRVRTLVDGEVTAGSHTVSWDGRSSFGLDVAAGLYLANLRAGGEVKTIKLLLVR